MSGRRVDIMGSRCPLTLDRGARPTIVSTQSHVQSRTQGFSDGNQIVIRPHATEQSVKNALVSPLDSPLMQARGTSQVQMQRNRYLTTPQSAYERPSIVTGPEYKFHRSTEHKSQAVHHEGTSNQRPITYKEQLLEGYKASTRRVVTSEDKAPLKDEWKTIMSEIREPIDKKLYDVEIELKAAQERGDTIKMNTCRDQIMSLEKQYLYNKKQSMKLLMDDKLGKSDRKQRMTADWYQTWEDFRVEVDEQKEVLAVKHTAEQKQFKNAVFEVAKQASELKVSEDVHEMRRQVSQLMTEGREDEARLLKKAADDQAMMELKGQSPLSLLRDKNLEQRLAKLALDQRNEQAEFENRVEGRAVGLATWRVGMEFIDN